MTRAGSDFARILALAAALTAAGCPPPPDIDLAHSVRRVRDPSSPPAAPGGSGEPRPPDPAPAPPDAVPPAETGEPRAPVVSATAKPSVYERLAGGIYVARCAACGAVQPEASTKCPSCGQLLRPWRQEQFCTVCAGSGECERCGDDRACLDCDGLGVCPFCGGSGKFGGDRCSECGGNARCAICQGDGRRESANRDFGPYETLLPGICPTCAGGSGLCPECGALTKDKGGGACLTCGGLGVCFDCGGTGLCQHDAGDGLCLVCRGGGREVFDGDAAKLSDRTWTLRSAQGSPITGRVLARPDPNVHVQMTQGGAVTRNAHTRAMLSALTYYLAMRDWTPETDGKGRLELGTVALASGFWAVAQQDFRRAMAADPTLASEAAAQLREVGERRVLDWLDAAKRARKAGDRDGASLFLHLVRFHARGTAQATQADVIQLAIQREEADEAEGLDEASKSRIVGESRARVERAASGARLHLDRAKRLLAEAQQRPAADPGVDRLLARADESARSAQRVVQREAFRSPATATPWPAKADGLVREGRLVRAEIAVFHAGRAIAGGRFDFGARLARRAASLDATNAQTGKLIEQAELGLARRGVLRGSPAPNSQVTRGLALSVVAAAWAASAGCGTAPVRAVPAESPAAPAPRPPDPPRGAGPWGSDPRWDDRAREIETASRAAASRLAAETGLSFERGREPVVTFDDAAPAEGDVVLRFVDGVRRPVVRVMPRALLSGEFRAGDDLAPLVFRGAILAGAGERDPPAWIASGVALAAGGAFERRLHQRALGGETLRSREDELFGSPSGDPLAAAARAKALARTARTERPFARLLQLVFEGRSEDEALAEMGIARREFLDAAAETDRDRAARAIADDPLLPALRDLRAALSLGETGRADAALAAVAGLLQETPSDAWIAADARLCVAEIAATRGETKIARAALDAALASSKIVRVRAARRVAAALAPAAERWAVLRALVADYPDLASSEEVARTLSLPAAVAARHPGLAADAVSADAASRASAALRLGASGSPESAVALRLFLSDSDASVRRSAVAGLALVLGGAADDDMEKATGDPDATVRRVALDLLAVSDRGRGARRAAAMRDDPDPAVRARAAELARPR